MHCALYVFYEANKDDIIGAIVTKWDLILFIRIMDRFHPEYNFFFKYASGPFKYNQ